MALPSAAVINASKTYGPPGRHAAQAKYKQSVSKCQEKPSMSTCCNTLQQNTTHRVQPRAPANWVSSAADTCIVTSQLTTWPGQATVGDIDRPWRVFKCPANVTLPLSLGDLGPIWLVALHSGRTPVFDQ